MSLHKHFCCPHCGGVIFYTGEVDATKVELENSKVSYPDKEAHIQRMLYTSMYGKKITHEQALKIFTGAWCSLFKVRQKTKFAQIPEWVWWRK